MRRRILFGLILLAALGAVVAIDRAMEAAWFGSLVVLAMTLIAQRELMGMMASRAAAPAILVNLGAVAIFAARTPLLEGGDTTLTAMLCGSVLALLIWGTFALQSRGAAGQSSIMKSLQAGVMALGYVALPLSFLVGLAWEQGTVVAGAIVLASKCGDMGGYLVGSLIGRHKVMPEVSPNKSWQGSFGGLALTVVVILGLDAASPGLFAGLEKPALVALALIINVATQLGDFAESMVKRCCEVKDSADLVPTFGGALDIVDSLIFAMPAATVALRFMD